MEELKAPTPFSYWVQPGKLLAGEHPGARGPEQARQNVNALLKMNISFFLNLTEAPDRFSYETLVEAEAARLERSVVCQRFPIPDFQTPSVELMVQILDYLDTALNAGHTVYLHCHAGIGRTGTVVGCYLARHGLSGEEALKKLAHLRRDTLTRHIISPETIEQRQMVLQWQPGK